MRQLRGAVRDRDRCADLRPLSLNWTVPLPGFGATSADRVTSVPVRAVCGTVSVVVVARSGTLTVIVCAGADELTKPAPLNSAVMLWLPAVANVCCNVAVPFDTDCGEPMFAPLSLNCTVPTAFDGVTVADNVTAVPVRAVDGADTVIDVGTTTETDCGAESDGLAFAVPKYLACSECEPCVVTST